MRYLLLALLLTASLSGLATPLKVTKLGGYLYIRGSFDSGRDIIQRMTLSTEQAFTNDTVDFSGARTVEKGCAGDDVAAFAGGRVIASQVDDLAPLKYNRTYIGGGHGALVVLEITAINHGKTVIDVGSDWKDADGTRFTLMRVVGVDKVWLVSENQSVAPDWSFKEAVAGPTLAHVGGAAHQGPITVSSFVRTQLLPAVQAQTKTILLDGVTPIDADGVYAARSLDIINTYNIPNTAAVVDYVRSRVGGSTQPSFVDASIAADVSRTITYRFAANASCTIYDSLVARNNLTIEYTGAVQAGPLEYAGKQLWQYIPQTRPLLGKVKTWDFSRGEDISDAAEFLHLNRSSWADVGNPPDRMMQVVESGGTPEFGFMIGYSALRAVGALHSRKDQILRAGFVSDSRKQYPIALEMRGPSFPGEVLAGQSFQTVAFRSFWSSAVTPDATAFTWYQDGNDTVVVADFHKAVSMSRLPLPPTFIGKSVSVVSKSDSFTIQGGGIVTADGLVVSVTGDGGTAVLRLR